MSEATFTFNVDETLKNDFMKAATLHDRTPTQLLLDFMRDIVRKQQEATDYDEWFRREVQIGLDSANAGNLIPGEEVEAEAAAWRLETRRKMAAS
jgi:predicted transcriptional regulator